MQLGDAPEQAEIPADLQVEAPNARARMVEQIVETDEDLTLSTWTGETSRRRNCGGACAGR